MLLLRAILECQMVIPFVRATFLRFSHCNATLSHSSHHSRHSRNIICCFGNVMLICIICINNRTPTCVLGSSGMQAEIQTLRKVLHAKSTQYEQKHGKKITAPSVAQMLGNTLYYKRFFPYYTFNVVCHSPIRPFLGTIPSQRTIPY
jgi:hypothetical protein